MSIVKSAYAALPTSAQNAAVTTYGAYWHWVRFGRGYKAHLDGYLRRDAFDTAEWQRWQDVALRSILDQASQAPYYRSAWSADERAAARKGVLSELPLLDKTPIRKDPRSFLTPAAKRRIKQTHHTSGSTGTPLASYWTLDEIRNSVALREARSVRWAGVSYSMPRATFSGRMVEPDPESDGPFYRYNRVEGQVYLSPFHLRPDTAAAYKRAIEERGVRWLTGYAVSYALLARFLKIAGSSVSGVRAVVTTSEKVTTEGRALMEEVFGCRVFEEYSTVENAVFASECGKGSLHISPDAGVIEILRPDGTPCDDGEVGEVVATSFVRRHQPFIRYRVGDLASWSGEPCACGRSMPVLQEVIGRIEDVVVTPDGRQLVRFHGVFLDQPNVVEGQIIQDRIDHIVVRVVPTDGFGDSDREDLKGRVIQRLGSGVSVDVELVEEIPRTSAGKFKAVISNVEANR